MRSPSFSREKWLARLLWNRIHIENTNAIVGAFGLPGQGKTYTLIRLAELLDPTFNLDRIVFSIEDWLAVIDGPPKLPRGSAIILDDTGRAANSRRWQSNFNQAFSDVGNTFRQDGYFMGATARVSGDIDRQFRELFHLTLEMKTRSIARGFISVKPMIPSMDTARGTTYWHYPRIEVPERGRCRVTRIEVHPSHFQTGPKLTWTAYEQKKRDFMRMNRRELRQNLKLERETGTEEPVRLAQAIIEAKSAGVSYTRMGKRLGISQSAVSQIVANYMRKNPAGDAG